MISPASRAPSASRSRASGRSGEPAGRSERSGATGPKCAVAAVGQQRVDREHVLARVAVAQRARAAGIVADHAADGGARGGRDVDRKPQAVRLEPAVELVEHDAGLDHAAPAGDVELEDVVEMFRAVDDQRRVDGLAALRGAAAARQHAHALLARDRDRALGLLDRARRHHAERHDLVVRGVGGVAAAGEAVERDLARELALSRRSSPGSVDVEPSCRAVFESANGESADSRTGDCRLFAIRYSLFAIPAKRLD